jgi:hypothetical protein
MMDDPVITVADGHTYEREAITKWFAGCKNALISPSTGMKLLYGETIANSHLKLLIQHFLKRRPELRRHKYINEMETKKKAALSCAPLTNSDLAQRINNSVRHENADAKVEPLIATELRTPREVVAPPKSPLHGLYDEADNKLMDELAPVTPPPGSGVLHEAAAAAVAAATLEIQRKEGSQSLETTMGR